MAEEFDVFAGAMKHQQNGNGGAGAPQPQHRGKKPFHKKFNRGGGQNKNNSPLRGANGEESVNPLLNAPLPTEQPVEMMEWLIEPSMLQPSATKLSRISADLEMKLDGMAWFLA